MNLNRDVLLLAKIRYPTPEMIMSMTTVSNLEELIISTTCSCNYLILGCFIGVLDSRTTAHIDQKQMI
jgi:hypothetical protein